MVLALVVMAARLLDLVVSEEASVEDLVIEVDLAIEADSVVVVEGSTGIEDLGEEEVEAASEVDMVVIEEALAISQTASAALLMAHLLGREVASVAEEVVEAGMEEVAVVLVTKTAVEAEVMVVEAMEVAVEGAMTIVA